MCKIVNEPGRTTTYTYSPSSDPNYTQMSIKDSATNEVRTWSYTYNTQGKILTENGPRTDVSDITSYTYYSCTNGGACGQVATMTNALGHTTSFDSYNAHGQATQMSDSNGQQIVMSYNTRQWMTSITVAGATTSMDYDAKGNIVRVTQPDGTYSQFTFDDADRLTAVHDAQGNQIEWVLDAAGNRTSETIKDPSGQARKRLSSSFDELSRMLAMVNAHGGSVSFAYDKNGNQISSIDSSNRISTSNFDALNRLIKMIDALSGETDYVYDDRDNLISVIDAEGLTTNYTYNGFDESISVQSPDTGTTTMSYDRAGNIATQTDARGVQVSYSYDALNRITQTTYPNAAENINYSYDQGANGTGRLTQISDASGSTDFSYDARGNTISTTYTIDEQVYTQSYTYNAADRLTGMTYPSGRSVSYSYDASGRIDQVSSVGDEGSETLASSITRLPFGPTSTLTLGNGVNQSRTYDQDYRVLTMADGNVFEKGYAYNTVNNLTAITDALDTAQSQLFSYDGLDRLEFAAGGYGEDDYAYDAIGNRLSTSRDNQSESYQYGGSSHQLQSRGAVSYSYDAAGNTLTGNGASFTYGDRNRMESVTTNGVTTTYEHNAMGQRVYKNIAGTQTHYIYDLNGRVISEANGSGAVLVEYSYLDGEPLAMWREPATLYGENVAPSGTAGQSSTGFGGDAGRASDGNTSGVYRQDSVTHTNNEIEPWWEVSLAERTAVSRVVLYNRTDTCCSARLNNVHVFVSEQPFGNQTLAQLLAQPELAHEYLAGVQGSMVDVAITGTGNYVRVQLAGTGVLSLAEVEVFGEENPTPAGVNLAPAGVASQSSIRAGGVPNRAIDENTSGVYAQGSVTHTNSENEPWWEVSLAERSDVSGVVLYNRTDTCCTARLSDVHVFVSEQPFGDQTLTDLLAQDDVAHEYLAGAQGSEMVVPVTGTANYVRVQLAGTGTLSLAEVEVYGVENPEPLEINLAPAGIAGQSSTGYGGAAGRAIDENTSGDWVQRSVTHTTTEFEPWWEVSLAERSVVNRVVLYNRTNCCSTRLNNVYVFVSEQPFGDQTLAELLAQEDIAHEYLAGVQGEQIEVAIAGAGSYVRVQLAGTGILSLAEVEVYGVENLSPAGLASQSSVKVGGVPSRGIDNNTSGVWTQGSVTHTQNENEPWWDVALAGQSEVDHVVLYNRTDCCASRLSDVHMFVSEQPFGDQTLAQLLARNDIAHEYLAGVQGGEIQVPVSGIGSYVRVQLEGTGTLSLAEVEVYGVWRSDDHDSANRESTATPSRYRQ